MKSSHKWSLYTALTDPPQVVTLQNIDQLAMLAGPDSDKWSNQFTVRTFHFITGYTEEDLAPFSEKYPKWTLVPSHVSASSGGDPYVFPLVGPVYKLLNCEEVYRLYQDDHVVIRWPTVTRFSITATNPSPWKHTFTVTSSLPVGPQMIK